jgi:hypothetical protein
MQTIRNPVLRDVTDDTAELVRALLSPSYRGIPTVTSRYLCMPCRRPGTAAANGNIVCSWYDSDAAVTDNATSATAATHVGTATAATRNNKVTSVRESCTVRDNEIVR